MGGELTVNSTLNQGTTFTVRLFLANMGGDKEKIDQQQIAGYQESLKKVLVVDDQPEHRQMIEDILVPLGFDLIEADSGKACLRIVKDNPPDIVLLDLSMPEMNGLETAERLRQSGYLLTIIVLTSNAYPSDRVNAINAGCNDFLAKPLQVQELLYKLKLHLGLNWNYQGNIKTMPDKWLPSRPETPPPLDIMETIAAHVRIGDLFGLNQYLSDISQTRPEHNAYYQRLLSLSNEFRLADIKTLINLNPEKADSHE